MRGFIEYNDKINPIIAIICSSFILLSGIILSTTNFFFVYYLSIVFVLLIFSYGKTLIKITGAMLVFAIVIVFLALIHTSFDRAITNGYRILSFSLSASIGLMIEPIRLVRSLNKMKVPRYITIGMLIVLKFQTLISSESRRVKIAMKTKNINIKSISPLLIYRAYLIPFITRLLTISDILSSSLETRGFSSSKEYSIYKEVKLRGIDFMFLISVFAVSLISFYLKRSL